MVTVFSDYIFILYTRQEQKQPSLKNSNEFIIAANNSVLTYLEQALDIYICDDKDALFEYRFTCKIKDFAYPVTFTINIVSDCTYLRISLDTQTTYQAIRVIEYIQDMITNSGIENEHVMIISYDSISEYYCNKAYPKLNRLERNLRHLLLNTYTVNFGLNYSQTTISSEMQNKIKSVIQAKGNEERKRIERLKKFFYSMEFSDIQTLLFSKNWTEYEETNRQRFLSENKKLTALPEKELREAFEKFAPRSDWERLFAHKATLSDIETMIESVRLSRNNIAHCKFFYKCEYESFKKSVSNLNKAILEAIRITEDRDFNEKRSESFHLAIESLKRSLDKLYDRLHESMMPTIETITETLKCIEIPDSSLEPIKASMDMHISSLPSMARLFENATNTDGDPKNDTTSDSENTPNYNNILETDKS